MAADNSGLGFNFCGCHSRRIPARDSIVKRILVELSQARNFDVFSDESERVKQ